MTTPPDPANLTGPALRDAVAPLSRVESERPACGRCRGPISLNPHPEAGNIARLKDVGAVWECIPCNAARNRRSWERVQEAERRMYELQHEADELRAALAAVRGTRKDNDDAKTR